MADPLVHSESRVNSFRLSSLLIDTGKVAIRSLFDHCVPPGNLQNHLQSNMDTLQTLKRDKHLKQSQEDLLFPSSTDPPVCSSNFDITLLILLLRNICGLREPSVEADIVKIREFRNMVQHSLKKEIEEKLFESYWTEMKDVILRVGRNIPNFEEQIDRLKKDSFDPEKEISYKAVLRQWGEMDTGRAEEVIHNVTARIDIIEKHGQRLGERMDEKDKEHAELDKRFLGLAQKQEESYKSLSDSLTMLDGECKSKVQQALERLQGTSAALLNHFMYKSEAFVQTRTFNDAKTIYEKSGLLVLSGKPGEGKSTLAVKLMLDSTQPERCIILNDPGDWNLINWKSALFDVVLIEDIFGKEQIDTERLTKWRLKMDTLITLTEMRKVRFIVTTPSCVLNDCLAELADFDVFTSEEHVVHTRTVDLSGDEMTHILTNHLTFHKREVDTLMVRRCISNYRHTTLDKHSVLISFPEMASIFSADYGLYEKGERYFTLPGEDFL